MLASYYYTKVVIAAPSFNYTLHYTVCMVTSLNIAECVVALND